MGVAILMPALSPTMTEGKLARWLKREGEKIKSGEVIAEIETDKATMEVEAVDEGVLTRIVVPEGTEGVAVNSVIAELDGGSAAAAPAPKAAPAEAPKPAAAPVPTTHHLHAAISGVRVDQGNPCGQLEHVPRLLIEISIVLMPWHGGLAGAQHLGRLAAQIPHGVPRNVHI